LEAADSSKHWRFFIYCITYTLVYIAFIRKSEYRREGASKDKQQARARSKKQQ
jgi:hypothetical protein